MADVPLVIVSDNAGGERRITPSWTISTLKTKLELVVGIPPSAMKLSLKTSSAHTPIAASDEDAVQLSSFPLVAYAELHVVDTRPAGLRPNYNDASGVDKYVMPDDEYEKKTDSVLAWKKAQKLGRFDPNAPDHETAKILALEQEIQQRGIKVGSRCRVGSDDTRRGDVMYVGEVPEIPNGIGAWVGVHLDEPMGKNNGSISGKRYWNQNTPDLKHGVFVRPDRIEIGDFPPINDLEDMEEI